MGSPSVTLSGNQATTLNIWVPQFIGYLADETAMTADTVETGIDLGAPGVLSALMSVTARSGTSPTLDTTIETSADGSTWYTAGTFAQKTSVTTERKLFTVDRYVRANHDTGGTTPSFTFTISFRSSC